MNSSSIIPPSCHEDVNRGSPNSRRFCRAVNVRVNNAPLAACPSFGYDAGPLGTKMTNLFRVLSLALIAATLAGCSACDFPLYVPQSCRAGPQPAQDAPPPGR
jgi:hypothetical protein